MRSGAARSLRLQHKHGLMPSVDPYGLVGFSCNICRRSFTRETSYHCADCRYDECSSCHSQLLAAEEQSGTDDQGRRCFSLSASM